MKTLFKYAIVLALGLALGFYVHGLQSLEDVAKLKWLDEINVIINKPFVAARPAAVAPVDPAAAALRDEDLDYRIARRIGSLDGWRSFLTAHGSGVHAQSAMEAVEKLFLAEKAPTPPAAEASEVLIRKIWCTFGHPGTGAGGPQSLLRCPCRTKTDSFGLSCCNKETATSITASSRSLCSATHTGAV